MDDEYKTYIPKLDDDHQKILDHFEVLKEKIKNNENIIDAVIKMQELIQEHFECEEKVFKNYDYPDKEAHIKSHQKINRDFLSLVEELKKSKDNKHSSVLSLLETASYIKNHFQKVDKKMAKYIKDNNYIQ